MVEQGKCPQCGKAVPSDTPQGLCPACLLRRGLETNTIGDTGGAGGARWTPPAAEELAPLFPELDIIELIGRGGMGAVYKAREKQLDRLVALKILPPEIGRDDSLAKSFAKRFAHEAQAMAKLSHSNIVTIHSFGSRAMGTGTGETAPPEPVPVSLYFFIMEYVDGLSLRQLLDAGTVNPKEALAIVPQICDALQYAHDRGIVHRDIKPENILLNKAGQVKIADFGLAKLVGHGVSGTGVSPVSATGVLPVEGTEHGQDARATHGQDAHATQEVMGTPQYMAPEQIDRPGEVDHRADIYSLGVVFYQMLTGELPVGRFDPPSRKVLIDVRLDEVVLRALEREPSRRYQQVSEVKTRVETIVATEPPARPASASGGQDAHVASSPDNEDASRASQPAARRASLVPALWAIVIHAVAFIAILAVLVFVVPKCEATFRDMGMELSQLTRATIAASHIACEWSFALFPMFLLLDAGVCLLLQYLAGQRARRWWSAILALTAAVVIATLGLGVGLPYSRMTQAMVRPADTSSPALPATQPAEVVKTAPQVLKTTPAVLADDVDPSLDNITVTFDRPMMDKNWSFTAGDKAFSEKTGTMFPERTGEISFDAARTICTMPVKLQPGKVYWVGINGPQHRNFKSADGTPARPYQILFATRSADGKPTPLPEELVKQARELKAAAQLAAQPATSPAKGNDSVVIKELALRVLRAIKDDDLATLKSLSAGSRQGWLEVDWMTLRTVQQGKIKFAGEPPVGWSESDLKSVTAEIRREFLLRNPDAATKVLQTLVQGDWAATLSPVTASQYLVMVFVKTDGGWRFATLDQSKGNLADDLAKHMANIPKNLKILRQLDHSSARQTATSTSSGPPASSNCGVSMSQPSAFLATGPATQPAP